MILFCVLTFIPFRYVHPFRVVQFRKITLTIISIWMVTTTVLLFDVSFNNALFKTINYRKIPIIPINAPAANDAEFVISTAETTIPPKIINTLFTFDFCSFL